MGIVRPHPAGGGGTPVLPAARGFKNRILVRDRAYSKQFKVKGAATETPLFPAGDWERSVPACLGLPTSSIPRHPKANARQDSPPRIRAGFARFPKPGKIGLHFPKNIHKNRQPHLCAPLLRHQPSPTFIVPRPEFPFDISCPAPPMGRNYSFQSRSNSRYGTQSGKLKEDCRLSWPEKILPLLCCRF